MQNVVDLQPTAGAAREIDETGTLTRGRYQLVVSSNQTLFNKNVRVQDAIDLTFTITPTAP